MSEMSVFSACST